MSDRSGTRDLRGDVLVAGSAAAASVSLTLVLRVLFELPIGTLPLLAPLLIYPLYLLLGRGDTGSVLEDPRLWTAAALVVALGIGANALR